jgi:hypothetical protein
MGARLSWAELAEAFSVSWADVYRSVRWVVAYGLERRDLSGVVALGVDETHVGRKEKFWTLVYQIDEHCKRPLWVGRDRTENLRDVFREVSPTGLHVTPIILSFAHSSLNTTVHSSVELTDHYSIVIAVHLRP